MEKSNTASINKMQAFPRVAAILVFLVGCLVILGWILDITALKSIFPGFVSMKMNTAICFGLAGVSLFVITIKNPKPGHRLLSQVFAVIIIVVGLLTLLEYILGLDFGIDQLFISEPSGAIGTAFPGRMTVQSALNFLFLGLGLLLLHKNTNRAVTASQYLSLAIFLIGYLAVIGYLYQFSIFLESSSLTIIAIPTVLSFLLISFGILTFNPEFGFMKYFSGNSDGSFMLRLLLPAIIIIPPFLEILISLGADISLYASVDKPVFHTLAVVLVLSFIVWRFALSLQRAEQKRKLVEEYSSRLLHAIQNSHDVFILTDKEGNITYVNPEFEKLYGYTANEVIGKNPRLLKSGKQSEKIYELLWDTILNSKTFNNVFVNRTKDGRFVEIENTVDPILNDNNQQIGFIAIQRDITERRQMEEALLVSKESLQESEGKLKEAQKIGRIGNWEFDIRSNSIKWSDQVFELFERDIKTGVPTAEEEAKYYTREQAKQLRENARQAIENGLEINTDFEPVLPGGRKAYFTSRMRPVKDEYGNTIKLFGTVQDITERKKVEEVLRVSEEKFRSVFENSPLGKTMIGVDGSLKVNKSFCDILGYSEEELKLLKWQEITHPDDIQESARIVQSLIDGEHSSARVEKRYLHKDGRIVWADVITTLQRDTEGKPLYFITTINDITEKREADEKLQNLVLELERSNLELEQFAYVASHDLQEPLRMVSSYTQLIERRYKDKLDQDANDFMNFAVDGANRMQALINDLLDYSRITTRGKELQPIDFNSALGQALVNLRQKIESTSAFITNDGLPVIKADEGQITRLFQNLIGNAIKFTRLEPPKIHIGCKELPDAWQFSVQDNGIGIDEQFKDRIFIIFQRLHTRKDYAGTGIGLAICKRIVERHKGKIWFVPAPVKGTIFYFTITKK
jgi:PAS domain S-box-containing protein